MAAGGLGEAAIENWAQEMRSQAAADGKFAPSLHRGEFVPG